jgi:hypothetical protein
MSKSLNYVDVDANLDFVLTELANMDKKNVDVPRLKEINNAVKTKIMLHAKVLSYCQLNKKGTIIDFFEK